MRLVVGLSLTMTMAATAVQAAPGDYLDDRSTPAALVRSLYNAVNRHEFARAWSYFANPPVASLKDYAEGYKDTAKVTAVTGGATQEGAAGSVYYRIPVAIMAEGNDGKTQVFAGCYEMRQADPQIQAEDFAPLRIEKGSLKRSEKPLDQALPAQCGDGPPAPQVDADLARAKALFEAVRVDACTPADDAETPPEPDSYDIAYRNQYDAPDQSERKARLFRFFCGRGAYNESHMFILRADDGGLRVVSFAQPTLDIRYENDDHEGKVESVKVIGFQTTGELVNSDYDPSTLTLTSFAKWRGVGDASSAGTWIFRDGDFSLVRYDVDASYNDEIDPETVLDYDSAP